jgi:hypothetical protein
VGLLSLAALLFTHCYLHIAVYALLVHISVYNPPFATKPTSYCFCPAPALSVRCRTLKAYGQVMARDVGAVVTNASDNTAARAGTGAGASAVANAGKDEDEDKDENEDEELAFDRELAMCALAPTPNDVNEDSVIDGGEEATTFEPGKLHSAVYSAHVESAERFFAKPNVFSIKVFGRLMAICLCC